MKNNIEPFKQRTADLDIYLKENRYKKPKEIFIKLAELAAPSISNDSLVVDLGCAAGEFLYYLKSRFENAKLIGADLLPELIEKAEKNVNGVSFRTGSVLDQKLFAKESLDVSFLQGVHSIFDDFEECFSNIHYWTKPGGQALIFGLFNNYPMDVWVQYRKYPAKDLSTRETGWNIFSKDRVKDFLMNKLRVRSVEFIPFELSFDMDPNEEDFARSWTFKLENGERKFTNGLSIICNLEILRFIK